MMMTMMEHPQNLLNFILFNLASLSRVSLTFNIHKINMMFLFIILCVQ